MGMMERMGPRNGASRVRDMSIKAALEWAFGAEHAQLPVPGENPDSPDRLSVSTVWVMMQRGAIGCKIDGGGTSDPHDDAEIIASFVAALPEAYGGWAMATRIAEMSRLGQVPDIGPQVPRCVPVSMGQRNRHGQFASTEDARHLGAEGWRPIKRQGKRGRIVEEPVLFCPVQYHPTAHQIAKARRAYLDWWAALLEIRTAVASYGRLSCIRITDQMPQMQPWLTARA